jgi:nicotinate-nucleotide adenylyltransferase
VLSLDQVLLLPSRVSPHRATPAHATNADRMAMVRLATNDDASLTPSDLELETDAPSYTAVTLERLHARGFLPTQLFFILGADAFAEIATWRHYPAVLDGAHFVIISRPGHPVAELTEALPDLRGRIHCVGGEPGRVIPDTDTSPLVLLIDAVTPDISSTRIRERLSRGEPLTGLVPTSVSTYIEHHRLYEPQRDRQLE